VAAVFAVEENAVAINQNRQTRIVLVAAVTRTLGTSCFLVAMARIAKNDPKLA
jgi:hypothetical protein